MTKTEKLTLVVIMLALVVVSLSMVSLIRTVGGLMDATEPEVPVAVVEEPPEPLPEPEVPVIYRVEGDAYITALGTTMTLRDVEVEYHDGQAWVRAENGVFVMSPEQVFVTPPGTFSPPPPKPAPPAKEE